MSERRTTWEILQEGLGQQRVDPQAVVECGRGVRVEAESGGSPVDFQELASILAKNHDDRPICVPLPPRLYYRLRSPASRVGDDGNFAGPTRARGFRTRASRRSKR